MTGGEPRRRIPLGVKVLYGAGDIGVALSATAIVTYLLFFYTDVVGLSIGLAGLVNGVARIWDAVIDPPMGYVSDNTRSRFGRRRFWFGFAAVPLGLCVFAVFSPPLGLGQWGLFAWMLIAYLLVNSFITMFLTPYYALGAELSEDPNERTQIVAVRLMFQYLGSVLGGFMPILALSFGGLRHGYSIAAAGFGALATLAILIAFFGTREPERPEAPRATFAQFWHGIRASLRNRAFRILLFAFLIMSVCSGIFGATSLYAFVYWLGLSQRDIGLLFPAILASAVVSLPVWTTVSARLGKLNTLKIFCIYMAFVFFGAYFLVPYKPLIWALMICQGFGLGGFAIAASLLADVIDQDELETSQQRGGAFFGFWTFASKFGLGLGAPVVGAILWTAGYAPHQVQSPLTLEIIRVLFGPVSGLAFVGAFLVIQRFPLTREAHIEVQAEVQRRRLKRDRLGDTIPGDVETSI